MKSHFLVIPTISGDTHALAIAEAAKFIGLDVWLWLSSRIAKEQEISIVGARNPKIVVSSSDDNFSFSPNDIFAVWNRRIRPIERSSAPHPSDRAAGLNNAYRFRNAVLALLNRAPHCVNDLVSAQRSEVKIIQLTTASEVGLRVPDTLMSNSSAAIRSFVNNGKERKIAKGFVPASWKTESGIVTNYSAQVSSKLVPPTAVMMADPMIFQPMIRKAYEVRVTFFGDYPVAIRLYSQRNKYARTDWRAVDPRDFGVERVELPRKIHESCKRLLAGLGLRFACLDFAVDGRGHWHFLELNQMGQFLWIEEVDPTIPMLDLFIQLIIRQTPRKGRESYFGIRFSDVKARVLSLSHIQTRKEVAWKHSFLSDETRSAPTWRRRQRR